VARKIATADRVDRQALLEFARPRHRGTLVTFRRDGRPQLSPVTCGVDDEGRVVVSDALERLVDYYRSISGEHPDWDEYRAAMATQNKSLIRIAVDGWGPVATGGFPPEPA
jgi:hypothetical protein